MPIVSPEVQLPVSTEDQAAREADLRQRIEAQVERVLGDAKPTIEIDVGDPANTVARAAGDHNTRLIVAGLGRHRILDRLFGDETALRLVRVAPVPVLAVARGFSSAPLRIIVAMDFSETSIRAARMALELASERATIYLAHVASRESSVGSSNGSAAYTTDAGVALSGVTETLRIPAGMSVQRVMLHGDPATELLAFATSVNADLIATGSHGHGFVARMVIGSVATKLIRCATCSVLTVPYAAAMVRTGFAVEAAPAPDLLPLV